MKWLPILFVAEAIPSAMITFVALLMFLQLGIGWEMSTLLCSLLTLPWMLKSLLREHVERLGSLGRQLRVAELLTFFLLIALAFSFNGRPDSSLLVFVSLFGLCVLSAWHELVAQLYYKQRLRRVLQRYYSGLRMFCSQAAVVLTYGAMIVVVGSLEVFYYNRSHVIAESWRTAVYLLAGVYLILLLWNLFTVGDARPAAVSSRPQQGRPAVLAPAWVVVCCLALLLLPQALMFHARVLFLIAPPAAGGLGCSLQWIGLAQGTVGVIAFSAGLILGHRSMTHGAGRWLYGLMAFAIGLSPTVYCLMTFFPPSNLLSLCAATATAQFCFGFGLHSCAPLLRLLFGERYEGSINYLYIPLISMVMLPAMAISGWLVARWGFGRFFVVDALLALPACGAALLSCYLNKKES